MKRKSFAFTPEIDPSTDNFRHNMQKVAAEKNAGSLICRGPGGHILRIVGWPMGRSCVTLSMQMKEDNKSLDGYWRHGLGGR